MKTTPCGLPVAIKRNKPKECDLLKALAAAASGKLFPAYYYYSNTTYGCYSEYLDYVKWSDALPAHAQREYSPAQLRTIKTLFLQGVTAVHK